MTTSLLYLIVDGHSVLFAWPELRELHQKHPALARERLLRELQTLHDTSHWRVTLIYDGKIGFQEPPSPQGFVLAYSQHNESADSLIERLVGSHSIPSQILVVTADQAECRTVESLGAHTASPAWLFGEMNTTRAQTIAALNKKRPPLKLLTLNDFLPDLHQEESE